MVCDKCGATLDDGVVYCTKCGARQDGKTQCRKCGEWLSEDVTYCPKCGTRADGKKECSKCGKLLDEGVLFCPDCGTSVQPVKAAKAAGDAQKSAATIGETNTAVSKILGKTKTAVALALAAISLLFAFLGRIDGDWIYYYFGDAYKDVDLLVGHSPFASKLSLYLPMVLGTVTTAAMLITTFVFALKALIGCGKQLAGKTEKSGETHAMAAFFSFAVGMTAIHLVTKTEFSNLDGVTVAGIVLGAIALAAYIALDVVLRGKTLLQKNTLIKTIFNAGGILMLMIMLILVSLPMLSMESKMSMGAGGEDYALSHTAYLMVMGMSRAWDELYVIIYAAIATLAFACTLVLLIYSAKHMGKKINDLTSPKNYVKNAVVVLVFSLLLLASSIAGGIVSDKGLGEFSDAIKIGYVIPIVVAVFAVLNLVLACVQKSFYNKIDAAEANE